MSCQFLEGYFGRFLLSENRKNRPLFFSKRIKMLLKDDVKNTFYKVKSLVCLSVKNLRIFTFGSFIEFSLCLGLEIHFGLLCPNLSHLNHNYLNLLMKYDILYYPTFYLINIGKMWSIFLIYWDYWAFVSHFFSIRNYTTRS